MSVVQPPIALFELGGFRLDPLREMAAVVEGIDGHPTEV